MSRLTDQAIAALVCVVVVLVVALVEATAKPGSMWEDEP